MKNNKIFVFLMSFAFAFLVPLIFASSTYATYAAEEEYVLISSYQDLKSAFANQTAFESNFKLTANIDLSQENDFLPLGLSFDNNQEEITSFKGIFDGDGYIISGLKFNSATEYYTYGFFAKIENAQIRNLIIEDIEINNPSSFNFDTPNNKTIIVGGVAAISESSLIENTTVSFADNSLDVSARRVDFGGVVARAYYGTTIKNVKVLANTSFVVETSKVQSMNVGIVVGEVYNSFIHNVIASGKIGLEKFETAENDISIINIGAVAGSVERSATFIKATYSNIIFEVVGIQNLNKGALVGLVKSAESPSASNISHNVMISQVKEGDTSSSYNQVFGSQSAYDSQNSVYNFLSYDNFRILEESSYWTGLLENYKWNLKTIWKLTANTLPVLQMFDEYEVSLSLDRTSAPQDLSVLLTDMLVIAFEDEHSSAEKTTERDFRYNQDVSVVIALINGFDTYYKITSVEINGKTVINKFGTSGNYSFSQVEFEVNEDETQTTVLNPYSHFESEKVYLFGFNVSDFDSGEISITIEKVEFDFTVETRNPDEGKVRRLEAQTPTNTLDHKVSAGGTYNFVAVPVNNNFALDRWVMQLVDEETEETYDVELDDFGKLSGISFEFGKNDSSPITENFLKGGKLVAIFSSNITKITFVVEEKDNGENIKAGQIFDGNEEEEFASSVEVSFLKGRTLTFVAKEKDGYTFVGWYDTVIGLRERNQILTYETIQDEDTITLIAVYEKSARAGSLTTLWIVLGSIGGAALIVIVIIIIKRKGSDMSYRSFY